MGQYCFQLAIYYQECNSILCQNYSIINKNIPFFRRGMGCGDFDSDRQITCRFVKSLFCDFNPKVPRRCQEEQLPDPVTAKHDTQAVAASARLLLVAVHAFVSCSCWYCRLLVNYCAMLELAYHHSLVL